MTRFAQQRGMFIILVTMLILLGCKPQGNASEVLIGTLEQPQCKEDLTIAVRVLFVKQEREWVALTSLEASQNVALPKTWTVGLDGRSLGTITTISNPNFQTIDQWTSRDRLLFLKPGQSAPNVTNKQGRFVGWCGKPNRRPLVVVSSPSVHDPDQWKPYQPENALRALLFESFKKHAGDAIICIDDSETAKPFLYTSQDLVFFSCYQDRFGRKLITLGPDTRRYNCDGPLDEAWAPLSFLLYNEKVLYLGSNLTLVDAGDYDSDDISELLFWYSGNNEDGYTLFYDKFQNHTEYHWKYH